MTAIAQEDPSSRLHRTQMGFWLVALIIVYSFINVGRALLAPAGFAAQMGLPAASSAPFVYVYALRMAFIAGFALWLVVDRDRRRLAVFAGLAVLMPLGDAVLVAVHGAGGFYVAKHLIIALYLMLTAGVLAGGWRRRRG